VAPLPCSSLVAPRNRRQTDLTRRSKPRIRLQVEWNPTERLSRSALWFQLVKIWVTVSNSLIPHDRNRQPPPVSRTVWPFRYENVGAAFAVLSSPKTGDVHSSQSGRPIANLDYPADSEKTLLPPVLTSEGNLS
jgi:hypothetical protein